jgi:hypothetical protein
VNDDDAVQLGPAYTILSEHVTPAGDMELWIRRAGGRTVKIRIPLATYLGGWVDDVVAVALATLPALPGPHT